MASTHKSSSNNSKASSRKLSAKHGLGKVADLADTGLGIVDRFAQSVDKVADTVNKVAPSVIDETSKVVDAHLDKHKDDFKMPDLIDVPLAEAQEILDTYHFKYSLIKVAADPQYAKVQPDRILSMTPKAKATVAPNRFTFVKAFYADSETIAASKQLIIDQENAKVAAKAAAKQAKIGAKAARAKLKAEDKAAKQVARHARNEHLVSEMTEGTKTALRDAKELAGKVTFHQRKTWILQPTKPVEKPEEINLTQDDTTGEN